MSKLSTIEGIGPSVAQRLKKSGIGSVEALLTAGATPAGRREISERSGLNRGRILKFVNHADLMRVRGIGGEYAELLEASGVDTVPELSMRNAVNLAAKMSAENDTKHLVRAVPSPRMVTKWVSQAKLMDKVVRH